MADKHDLPSSLSLKGTDVLKQWISDIKHGLIEKDTRIIGLCVAVIAILLTFVVFSILKKRKNLRRGILLMGICESGKTALFLRLVRRSVTQTYTSIKENSGIYQTKRSKYLKLMDIPGHERLRNQYLASYGSLARGIVYVIDSSTLTKEIRDVAEYLYTLLGDAIISKINPPFLIVCNKQDMSLAKGSTPCQALLEKEINTLRVTKSAALDSLEDIDQVRFIGKQNKEFEFSDLKPIQIKFIECHVTTDNDVSSFDVQAVEDWLDKIA